MRRVTLKLAVISALRSEPNFAGLRALFACSSKDSADLLTWLDHSGLALYFFARLRDRGELGPLPPDFRDALKRRFHSNCKRMEAMVDEFSKVNAELRSRAIPHAFLKGFTLSPEFCPDPALRHQSDLDILVHADSLTEATQALSACRYSLSGAEAGGGLRFATPLQYVPSARDDIYRVTPHREAELHTSVWETTGHVSLVAPKDCLERTRRRKLRDIEYFSLVTEDMFLMQGLHAFSHLLGSWVRVSWLWEIHYFLQTNAGDAGLWHGIIGRAGHDPKLRKSIGLVLCLTTELFGGPIPEALDDWCLDALPERLETWVRHFGTQWALSELAGSKVTLFIHKEFVDDSSKWRGYLVRRLIPVLGKPSIGRIGASDVKTRLVGRAAQLKFSGQRLAFHARELFVLAGKAFRWRHVLKSRQKGRAVLPCPSNTELENHAISACGGSADKKTFLVGEERLHANLE
jgi:hypothetical protein